MYLLCKFVAQSSDFTSPVLALQECMSMPNLWGSENENLGATCMLFCAFITTKYENWK